jgi:large subunit ribosomal protein L25
MERVQLAAKVRREMGKGPSRRLRARGEIPGVVYGPRMATISVSLEPKELKRALASGENVLVNLNIQDGEEVQSRLVMVKEYDVHPRTERLWHVDLYEISLEEAIKVDVPIVLKGQPVGVVMGGMLSSLLRTVEISCLPEQIPSQIEVDCSALKIGDTVHVRDLSLPEEIHVMTDPSFAVATVMEAVVEAAPKVEVAEEGEEAAGTEETPET